MKCNTMSDIDQAIVLSEFLHPDGMTVKGLIDWTDHSVF